MKRNVLVTSISKKIPLLKTVRSAIEKIGYNYKLYGADLNPECIGRYFVDEFWHMPHINQLEVWDLVKYCKQNQISYVIPTRDGELSFFSKHKQDLEDIGIYIMVSNPKTIEMCIDKLEFTKILTDLNFPVIPSYEQVDLIMGTGTSYVVKERYGSGSRNIALNVSKGDAVQFALHLNKPIFQPYIDGDEYSIDVYVDKKGKTKGIVVRKRELIQNGESQITTTVSNKLLERLTSELAEKLQIFGHAVFQVMINRKGDPFFIECNCRFGGASTLSVEMGLDSFYWFFTESNGRNLDEIPFIRSEKEKKLIRYPEDLIL